MQEREGEEISWDSWLGVKQQQQQQEQQQQPLSFALETPTCLSHAKISTQQPGHLQTARETLISRLRRVSGRTVIQPSHGRSVRRQGS